MAQYPAPNFWVANTSLTVFKRYHEDSDIHILYVSLYQPSPTTIFLSYVVKPVSLLQRKLGISLRSGCRPPKNKKCFGYLHITICAFGQQTHRKWCDWYSPRLVLRHKKAFVSVALLSSEAGVLAIYSPHNIGPIDNSRFWDVTTFLKETAGDDLSSWEPTSSWLAVARFSTSMHQTFGIVLPL